MDEVKPGSLDFRKITYASFYVLFSNYVLLLDCVILRKSTHLICKPEKVCLSIQLILVLHPYPCTILQEYLVILTSSFYGINQKISTKQKKGYFQNFT